MLTRNAFRKIRLLEGGLPARWRMKPWVCGTNQFVQNVKQKRDGLYLVLVYFSAAYSQITRVSTKTSGHSILKTDITEIMETIQQNLIYVK